MLEDTLLRGWENFIGRTTGSMNFRFILQPTVAALLALRAGVRDSREGRPAFLWSVLTRGHDRKALLHDGFKDVGKVFVLAMILDSIYQVIAQGGIYALELLFTAVTLALVPYVLLRGPVNRITTWLKDAADRKTRKGVGGGGTI